MGSALAHFNVGSALAHFNVGSALARFKMEVVHSVTQQDGDRSGLLLIGHGTRDRRGTDQFVQLAALLAERLDPLPVEGALLEFQEPTIPNGWNALVDRGVNKIHVAPLLLFAAGHAKEDIPNILRDCHSRSPDVQVERSRPLSRHPSIIDLACVRLKSTLARNSAPPERTAVVMVGRGSHDPCAQADMRVLTEVLSRRVEVAHMATAFYAMANPRLPVVLDELASGGQFDAIIVQPHLLFEGRLFQAIVRQTSEAAQRHSNVAWLHSEYLGPDPSVAEAIAARAGLS